MIILKILFPSIISHLHCHVHSKGCCRLQIGFQPHYHAADSVLTCGWTFINQQISNKICIAHVILGIRIKIAKSSTGKQSIYIHISGWHTFRFGASSCFTVIWLGSWRSESGWHRSWQRCTCAFAPPTSLWILFCAILARKTAVCLIFPKLYQVSFYRSRHLVIPEDRNTSPRLLSNSGAWFLD